MALDMADPNPETRGEGQQKQDKKKIVAGLGGRFPSAENGQVEHNQHQHDGVEAYPVCDRSAIEHYPMLACAASFSINKPHVQAPPFPLSSRAKPRDLQSSGPLVKCFSLTLVEQPDRLQKHIAHDGKALRAQLIHGVLRSVPERILVSVIEIDNVGARHACAA